MMRCICLFLAILTLGTVSQGASTFPAPEAGEVLTVLLDVRVRDPIQAIVDEYHRRTGVDVSTNILSASDLLVKTEAATAGADVVVIMADKKDDGTAAAPWAGAKKVAWKHPSGEAVWAAALTTLSRAEEFVRFTGGPTGHRLWSESPAGFTMTTGKTHAEAFEWVVENRVKQTYPLTAMRILGELGGIRKGVCVDIGCGTGNLDIEIAKRSEFAITGLDIDPDMKPLFEKRVEEAGLQDRLEFVVGDAQEMPFPDDFADVVISRGTLTFIPDIAKCLREVDRIMKPTGVAFLGGRYLYTPHADRITDEKLKEIVALSGVPGAQVVSERGQWVKIIGPEAPKAALSFQGGPHMLMNRFIADYAIFEGKALLICGNDGKGTQAIQESILDATRLDITALYPKNEVTEAASKRLAGTPGASRIVCKTGTIDSLPFDDGSFDLIAGVGPALIFGDRQAKMREVYRVLRDGGAALFGGRFLGMPPNRRVSSDALREDAVKTGLPGIRVIDDMGQWVEFRKGIANRPLRD